MSLEQQRELQTTRELLGNNLLSVIGSEDPSPDNVLSWVSSLSSLTQKPDEISSSLASSSLKMSLSILIGIQESGLGYLSALPLITSMDLLVSSFGSSLSRRCLLPSSYSSPTSFTGEFTNMLSSFSNVIGNELLVGQDPVSILKCSFRMSVTKFPQGLSPSFDTLTSLSLAPSIQNNLSINLVIPQSSLEKFIGSSPQTIGISLQNVSLLLEKGYFASVTICLCLYFLARISPAILYKSMSLLT